MASGTIEISRRANAWADRLRSYAVHVDGERVGEVGRGETVSFPVDAGPHTVQFKLDWGLSEVVAVEVADGGRARVECFARSAFAAFYYSTLGRKRYIGAVRIDG